jgi:hypothetical protein
MKSSLLKETIMGNRMDAQGMKLRLAISIGDNNQALKNIDRGCLVLQTSALWSVPRNMKESR